jgi:hypothetical protein
MEYSRKTIDEYRVLRKDGYGYGWTNIFSSNDRGEARTALKTYKSTNPQDTVKMKKVRIPVGS